ncbi:MAG TPA: preprotein translocase subunit SecY [Candidatus Dependentiae bacterium]|nr:preprotein translocase subunit SecY [Candidatus Dependentiae bacterium]HRQ62317.1 preprotein translocase subunit SecY [Candidatus Dependentiae bacterium]
MILLKNFINIFFVPELRRKVLYTLGILIVFRLGSHIPVIGIDIDRLLAMMQQPTGLGGLFSYLDLFSGGNLRQCTLFALGIMPYITASIMMQMLTLSVPNLEQLAKEGEYGRKIINQYTRYLTLGVCILQSFSLAVLFERMNLVIDPGWAFRFIFILSITVGALFVMWLGEQISLFGIGNGTSMIIFAGIVARFPGDVIKLIGAVQERLLDPLVAVLAVAIVITVTACIVFLEKGERKIPVQYTRRVVGQRVYGGQSTYIPFKINTAGVMPVIFSTAVLNIPVFLSSVLAARFESFKWVVESFAPTGILYSVLLFILIMFFSFFYTALQFNPDELAENIKKGGGFIPGIRPGKKTAEFFNYILMRLGTVGAVYLGILALFPTIIHAALRLPFYLSIMGGTSLLIVVGVALETAAQIESYLIEHRYEGFLTSGRLKGR